MPGVLLELKNQLGNRLLRLFYEFGLFFILHFGCRCFEGKMRLLFLVAGTCPHFPEVMKANRQLGAKGFHCQLLIWAAQFQEQISITLTYLEGKICKYLAKISCMH